MSGPGSKLAPWRPSDTREVVRRVLPTWLSRSLGSRGDSRYIELHCGEPQCFSLLLLDRAG